MTNKTIQQPAREIPVLGDYDVVVIGSGPAGCAAACAAAGYDWVSGANGLPYAMGVSLGARVGGITCDAETVPGQPHRKYGMGRVMPGCHQAFLWAARILETDPLDPWAVTAAMRQGRAELWQRIQDLRQIPGNEHIFLIESAQDLGVRSSRRVTGIATVTRDDAWSFRKQPGSIARSSWEIDIHSARELKKSAVDFDDPAYRRRIELTKSGEYFDIPYGCLVPAGVEGLLVAGRCLSAEHEAQASLRIQQTCMATGEAAGLAAALSIERNLQPAELPAETVAVELQRRRDAVEPVFGVIAAALIATGHIANPPECHHEVSPKGENT